MSPRHTAPYDTERRAGSPDTREVRDERRHADDRAAASLRDGLQDRRDFEQAATTAAQVSRGEAQNDRGIEQNARGIEQAATGVAQKTLAETVKKACKICQFGRMPIVAWTGTLIAICFGVAGILWMVYGDHDTIKELKAGQAAIEKSAADLKVEIHTIRQLTEDIRDGLIVGPRAPTKPPQSSIETDAASRLASTTPPNRDTQN